MNFPHLPGDHYLHQAVHHIVDPGTCTRQGRPLRSTTQAVNRRSSPIRSSVVRPFRMPSEFCFDPPSIGRINLPRCLPDVTFGLVAYGSAKFPKTVHDVRFFRNRSILFLEPRWQRCPDYGIEFSGERPLAEPGNATRGSLVAGPTSDVLRSRSSLAYSQALSHLLEIFAVHERPQRTHRVRGRYDDQGNSTVLRLARKLKGNQRSVLEPVPPNRQIARIPDQRSPTKTCNIGQLPSPPTLTRLRLRPTRLVVHQWEHRRIACGGPHQAYDCPCG